MTSSSLFSRATRTPVLPVAAAVLTAALALAWLSHRLVERPAQTLGHRLATTPGTQRAAPRTAREQNGTRSV